MANQEHLDLLKHSVALWNEWRREYFHLQPDLEEGDLTGYDLSGADLSRANLKKAVLSRAILNEADLTESNLHRAIMSETHLIQGNLHRANLNEAYLCRAILREADLSDSYLQGAYFSKASLSRALLRGADLNHAILREARLIHANLALSNLSHANLAESNLSYANLSTAILEKANLAWADLSSANLNKARLSKANLSHTRLEDTDLTRADLRDTDLREAQIYSVLFYGANLSAANLSGASVISTDFTQSKLSDTNLTRVRLADTVFASVDFRSVKKLDTMIHLGPSIVDIKTVLLPQGNASKSFLQGVGFTDTFVDYLPSLANTSIHYHSCFISYANADETLARRLYADLQSEGVRCWFAPEDLKWGDKIRPRIDESIRLYDKLLLVLSQHSVTSQWVEQEVETALEKERKENRTVLFPIRLDKVVMEIEGGWPALIRNTRNIGDFTCWKRHDAYQKALERLLRDLKAGA
jgi:uncharacterized protein YjbI with pentapeptide repeats